MPTNSKEYMKQYMKKYVENSKKYICPNCGSKIKEYLKTLHNKTKKHQSSLKLNK
jgi:predicted RNA-binding Zn-ribbon protein involved in translation (DUF1610 family)